MPLARYDNRRGTPAAPRGPAYDPDTPAPGRYRIRKVRGGPFVAVQIWLGHPLDPDTGEEMTERGMRWQCRLNGSELVPVEDYWPGCAKHSIGQAEHDRICRLSRTMNPRHAYYDPKRPINRLTVPTPFGGDDVPRE
jgi:hypothetical protein